MAVIGVGCGSAGEAEFSGTVETGSSPPGSTIRVGPLATDQALPSTIDNIFSTAARQVIPSPDIGTVTDGPSLVAALVASGPLDNQTAAAAAGGPPPDPSICAQIVVTNEPTAGTVVHQAVASRDGIYGVVLVLQRSDGTRQARMYGVGDADPVSGGCPLWITADM